MRDEKATVEKTQGSVDRTTSSAPSYKERNRALLAYYQEKCSIKKKKKSAHRRINCVASTQRPGSPSYGSSHLQSLAQSPSWLTTASQASDSQGLSFLLPVHSLFVTEMMPHGSGGSHLERKGPTGGSVSGLTPQKSG